MGENEYIKPFLEGSAKLGIAGQGYVGLPLAEVFAASGIHVLGFDIDEDRVARINRGESDVSDVPSARLKELVEQGLIEATGDFSRLGECAAISICVPTPLSKSKDPDLSYIEAATREIKRRLKPGQLIVLESTSYPGTTEEIVLPMLEETGMKVGVDFFLAFSPERVDPGNKEYNVYNTPKIIGAVTPACLDRAVALYSHALEKVYPVSSTKAAEMVKLLENTFRAVNIAFVNELAQMCKRLKVDVWEVIEAAKTKPFGFEAFYPGPGLGGHCIPVDPLYLSWKLHHLDYKAQFIDLADTINASMPGYVVGEVSDQLNDDGLPVRGSRILLLGVAYKENIDDVRESPALDLASLLMAKGAEVVYHDPFVPRCTVDGKELLSQPLDDDLLRNADLVLIATGHSSIDYARVTSIAKRVFDTRNVTGPLGEKGNVRKI
ncbi:nucleotide sugar dehydrogenase [bacterium]|nr:nucleotide sugar dehydrogenase [bacterium]